MNLSVEGSKVLVGSEWWQLEKPVLKAAAIQDKVLVIFDYMSFPKDMPAKNLVAYDKKRKEVWTAQNPEVGATDAYVSFIKEEPLEVGNFAGYNCRIDITTGRLMRSEFTK
jgi:hypothetical protein